VLGGFVTTGCATVERFHQGGGENGKQEYIRLNVSWEVPKTGGPGPVTYVVRYATLVGFGAAARAMQGVQAGDRVVILDGDAKIGKPYEGKDGPSTPLEIYVGRWIRIPREEVT
jgi:hypothetical protein